MTNGIMTPSEAGREQVGKVLDTFGSALLRKHYLRDAVQEGLACPGLATALVDVFDKHIQSLREPVVRRVTVNPTWEPQALLEASRRIVTGNDHVIEQMPRYGAIGEDVIFFPLFRFVDEDEAVQSYESRNLRPAHPFWVIDANKQDRTLADEHPNITLWKNPRGHWCFMEFSRTSDGDRTVVVDHCRGKFGAPLWYAGVPK